jgi:hypothetical protein
MSDPLRIFTAASSSRQETLKAIWPELYESLAGTDEPASGRVTRCALYVVHAVDAEPDRPAVGRATFNGHPACDECLAALGRRFPLKLQPWERRK